MAKIKKQVKTVDKWKKKKWFTLLAPKMFQERALGQTCCSNPDILPGRTISANLMSLTGNIRKQNMVVQFEITHSEGSTAKTRVKKIELVSAFLKRKVRRNRDRIDASFVCTTKDKKTLRIKPLLITLSKSSKDTQKALRKKLINHLINLVSRSTYDDFMGDIINYKVQRTLKNDLRKLFPVIDAEIRSAILLSEESAPVEEVKKVEEVKEVKKETVSEKVENKDVKEPEQVKATV